MSTADYGLKVLNDYGSVTVSSLNKVLVYSQRGQVRVISQFIDQPGYGAITFQKVIDTYEPPQLFVNWESGFHQSLNMYITFTGGPNNWTGFLLTSGVNGTAPLQNHLLNWVACVMVSTSAASGYGLNIYDEFGKPTYNSDARVVRYKKFTKSWRQVSGGGNGTIDTFFSDVPILASEYIMVTPFERGLNWMAGANRYVTVQIRAGGEPTCRILWQKQVGSDWYNNGMGGTYFSIPICEFPIDKYYG